MSLRINSNVQSKIAQRSFNEGLKTRSESLAKLSSGQRINKSADEASSLAIGTKLQSISRGSQMAERNANDGISLIQVAEGGLTTIGEMLIRLRELAVQSASDTYSTEERYNLDTEFKALKEEIDRVSQSVEFNGTKLLDGRGGKITVQIGVHNVASEDRLGLDLGQIDASINKLFETGYDAKVYTEKSRTQVTKANFDPNLSNDQERERVSKEVMKENERARRAAAERGHEHLTLRTKQSSQQAISSLDVAIKNLSKRKSLLGSTQNRLHSVIGNLQESRINLEDSKSKLLDVDLAKETAINLKEKIKGEFQAKTLKQVNDFGKLAAKLVERNL